MLNIIQNVIIGATPNKYNDQRILDWLEHFHNQGKLKLVSDGNGCIGNCIVNGGLNFCNNQNIRFDILAANVVLDNRPYTNQMSIVMKVSANIFTALLPGDMEGPVASLIAERLGQQMQSAIYKIAHHGASRLANKQDWLAPIQPKTAFASSGYNFGNCRHPRCEAICNLMPLGVTNIKADSEPHTFYCGNYPGNPVQRQDYRYSIYETTPTANTMCIIKYSSDFRVSNDCNQVQEMSISGSVVDDDDDECSEEEGDEYSEVLQPTQTSEIYKNHQEL